ncbi:hypothetical protein VTK26DRAFT_7850 [Humicola hyalothermophila]
MVFQPFSSWMSNFSYAGRGDLVDGLPRPPIGRQQWAVFVGNPAWARTRAVNGSERAKACWSSHTGQHI